MLRITTRATLALAALLTLGACNREDTGEAEAPLADSAAPTTVPVEELATWQVRLDAADADVGGFQMTEESGGGWSVKTAPNGAAITWRGRDLVEGGSLRASTTIEERGAPADHREGYGLFIGGRNLQQPDQHYTYFLVRGSGDYLIKRREGDATPTPVDWTASPAIQKVGTEGAASQNTLEVRVDPEVTRFYVNGTEVKSLPTEQVQPYGIAGLRVNHALDVLVKSFEVGDGQGTTAPQPAPVAPATPAPADSKAPPTPR
jgi:hypothetical protein